MAARRFGFALLVTSTIVWLHAPAARAQVPGAPALPPQNAVAPAAAAPAPAVPAAPGAAGAVGQDGMQVLDEGPIHEAFAEPIVLDARPRVVTDREPPEPINEVPPAVKPDGENVEWIPGYWMWSDIQKDFVWVSGVWRDVPPGRRWVPGHWTKAAGGFEWVAGLWAGAEVQEVQMLPNPPDTLEVGPSSPAPGDNFFWVPGCWVMQNGGFAWRAGYWYAGQQNWVWVPDHYNYTPGGSIFVSGYWDYPLVRRGLLYAPVWWPQRNYGYAGFAYRPYRAINASLLLGSLFFNDRYHGYYYGHGRWNNNHFHPWWDRGYNGRGRYGHGYDPLWAYHRWHDGRNRNDWHDHMRRDWDPDRHHGDWAHNGRPGGRPGGNNGPGPGGPNGRGPGGPGGGGRPGGSLIDDVDNIARNNPTQVRIQRLTDTQVRETTRQVADWTKLREARAQFDAGGAGRGGLQLGGAGSGKVQTGGQRPGGPVQAGGGAAVGGNVQAGGQTPGGGQVAVGGQGSGRGNLGSPYEGRRSTFKLPQTDSNIGGAANGNVAGAANGNASARTTGPQGRGSWSGRGDGQVRTGGPVVTPGASAGTGVSAGAPSGGNASAQSGANVVPRQFTQPSGQTSRFQQPGNWSGSQRWQGGTSGRVVTPGPSNAGSGVSAAPTTGRPGWSYGSGGSGNSQFRSQGQPSGRGAVYSRPSQSFQGSGRQFQSSGGGGSPSVRGNYQPPSRSNFNSGGGGGGRVQPSIRSSGGGGGGQSSFRSSGGGGGGGQSAVRGGGGGGGNYSGRGRGRN